MNPEALPFGVRVLIDAAEEIFVVAPRLPTRLDWITSDTDRAQVHADERLQAVLGHLDELGVTAKGAVGADDPLVALEDAIRRFGPDHLLIALRSRDTVGLAGARPPGSDSTAVRASVDRLPTLARGLAVRRGSPVEQLDDLALGASRRLQVVHRGEIVIGVAVLDVADPPRTASSSGRSYPALLATSQRGVSSSSTTSAKVFVPSGSTSPAP